MRNSPSAYGWLMLAGIAVSLFLWVRLGRRNPRLIGIYVGGLMSAMVGAKLVFLLAEGWLYLHHENRWMIFATGKSILGALLGGYAGVEITKRMVGYNAPTGDLFALVVPLGIMFGRIGCILHGCCLGTAQSPTWFTVADFNGVLRWPAAHFEFAFNLIALLGLALCHLKRLLPNQLFHVYLIAYGLFRIANEFYRDTPRIAAGITGYQLAAVAVFALGCARYWTRARTPSAAVSNS